MRTQTRGSLGFVFALRVDRGNSVFVFIGPLCCYADATNYSHLAHADLPSLLRAPSNE
jgi:hypothetical protein